MCGFIGCVHDKEQHFRDEQKQQFKNMNDIITHRGPDDDGFIMMIIFNSVFAV